ncbi:AMP-binding protein [Cellulomonas sp. URHE0023]|uniref:AMP-binding protein n=1 Tax=Cellulomonas sp. URHE0023 TaxID=1380354 RepID=UPI00068C6FE3|nr:AMP-binding protein [Cellulomonas sp. URHE0023]
MSPPDPQAQPEPTRPDPMLLDPTLPDPALTEYAPMGAAVLTDQARWPTLDGAGLARVAALRAHPRAPVWVHATGDRLTADDQVGLEEAAARFSGPADDHDWVAALVARVHATVPRYRRAARDGTSGPSTPLADLPTTSREDLVRDVASFVPVDVDLTRVLEGSSSGSTGAALVVPLHPVTLAADLLLVQALLATEGVRWEPVDGRLGLVNVVDQRTAFTYASAMTAFRRVTGADAPLMARINLDASAWRDEADRDRFLSELDPQVVSTSTLPLLRLLELGLDLHPVAVVNGATDLPASVRSAVERRWGCPVLDVYGLTETGPVAASADGSGHVVVGRRVWVEILDAAGRPVPDGTRGEIVVTVDENPYLPLLRYRTGDHASLVRDARGTVLVGLEGRAPVVFVAADGTEHSSIDATQLLQAYGLAVFHLHQDVDGAVHLETVALSGDSQGAADAIARWLTRPVALTTHQQVSGMGTGKPRRFSSDRTSSDAQR